MKKAKMMTMTRVNVGLFKKAATFIWVVLASIITCPIWLGIFIFMAADLFSNDYHNYQKRP